MLGIDTSRPPRTSEAVHIRYRLALIRGQAASCAAGLIPLSLS